MEPSSSYLPPAEELPSVPLPVESEQLHLIKPENVKSRFWVHFMKYDPEFHPDKKTTARCNLCGKDISVKQGTGGLKNHLKFKHPEENSRLFENDEDPTTSILHPQNFKMEPGTPASRAGAPATSTIATPSRKKPRANNAYLDTSMRLDEEKRTTERHKNENEKHLMEMWVMTRREIREIRKELKEEDNHEIRKELEGDVRVLKKRKGEYADILGLKEDEEVAVTNEQTDV